MPNFRVGARGRCTLTSKVNDIGYGARMETTSVVTLSVVFKALQVAAISGNLTTKGVPCHGDFIGVTERGKEPTSATRKLITLRRAESGRKRI
jgi:hypothetical protein